MAKFLVEVKEVHTYSIEVEAETDNLARAAAAMALDSDEYIAEYSYTMEPEEWTVEEVLDEKFELEADMIKVALAHIETLTESEIEDVWISYNDEYDINIHMNDPDKVCALYYQVHDGETDITSGVELNLGL